MITIHKEELLKAEEVDGIFDILKEFIKDYKDINVGIYANGKIKMILTYQDIMLGRKVITTPLVHNVDIFEQARDLFFSLKDNPYSCIPVIEENGDYLYYLANEQNQVNPQDYVSEFKNYDIYDKNIDFELVMRAEVFLFFTFEEYSYQIARILHQKFPDKKLFFFDNQASKFFDSTSEIKVLSSQNEFYLKYKNLLSKSIICIDANKNFQHNTMRFIIKCYSSLQIMTSLFWCCDITTFGDLHPDKTFYLIKNPLQTGGMADLIKFTLYRAAMADKKPCNYIPVIDLSLKEDANQFTNGNGDNAWTYFFEQITDVPLKDVYKSKNVIISHDQLELFNPYVQEYAYFMDWKTMFGEYLKFNDVTFNYVKELYEQTIFNKEAKILGVIGRGTDYRCAKGRWVAEPMEGVAFLNTTTNLFNQMNYDYIFLATEDAEVFDLFMKSALKDKIIFVDQSRVDYSDAQNKDLFLAEIKQREQSNGYQDNLKYLGILYILSKCSSLISTCVCGASNIAIALKEGAYEYIQIF